MVTTTTMSWGKPTSSGFTILIPTGTTKIDPKTAVVLNWGGGGGSSTPTPTPTPTPAPTPIDFKSLGYKEGDKLVYDASGKLLPNPQVAVEKKKATEVYAGGQSFNQYFGDIRNWSPSAKAETGYGGNQFAGGIDTTNLSPQQKADAINKWRATASKQDLNPTTGVPNPTIVYRYETEPIDKTKVQIGDIDYSWLATNRPELLPDWMKPSKGNINFLGIEGVTKPSKNPSVYIQPTKFELGFYENFPNFPISAAKYVQPTQTQIGFHPEAFGEAATTSLYKFQFNPKETLSLANNPLVVGSERAFYTLEQGIRGGGLDVLASEVNVKFGENKIFQGSEFQKANIEFEKYISNPSKTRERREATISAVEFAPYLYPPTAVAMATANVFRAKSVGEVSGAVLSGVTFGLGLRVLKEGSEFVVGAGELFGGAIGAKIATEGVAVAEKYGIPAYFGYSATKAAIPIIEEAKFGNLGAASEMQRQSSVGLAWGYAGVLGGEATTSRFGYVIRPAAKLFRTEVSMLKEGTIADMLNESEGRWFGLSKKKIRSDEDISGRKVWHFTTPESAENILKEGYKFGEQSPFLAEEKGGGLLSKNVGGEKIQYFTRDTYTWSKQVMEGGKQLKTPKKLVAVEAIIKPKTKVLKIESLKDFQRLADKYGIKYDFYEPEQSVLSKIIKGAKAEGYDIVKVSSKGRWEFEKGADIELYSDIAGKGLEGLRASGYSPYDIISSGGGKLDYFVLNPKAIEIIGMKGKAKGSRGELFPTSRQLSEEQVLARSEARKDWVQTYFKTKTLEVTGNLLEQSEFPFEKIKALEKYPWAKKPTEAYLLAIKEKGAIIFGSTAVHSVPEVAELIKPLGRPPLGDIDVDLPKGSNVKEIHLAGLKAFEEATPKEFKNIKLTIATKSKEEINTHLGGESLFSLHATGTLGQNLNLKDAGVFEAPLGRLTNETKEGIRVLRLSTSAKAKYRTSYIDQRGKAYKDILDLKAIRLALNPKETITTTKTKEPKIENFVGGKIAFSETALDYLENTKLGKYVVLSKTEKYSTKKSEAPYIIDSGSYLKGYGQKKTSYATSYETDKYVPTIVPSYPKPSTSNYPNIGKTYSVPTTDKYVNAIKTNYSKPIKTNYVTPISTNYPKITGTNYPIPTTTIVPPIKRKFEWNKEFKKIVSKKRKKIYFSSTKLPIKSSSIRTMLFGEHEIESLKLNKKVASHYEKYLEKTQTFGAYATAEEYLATAKRSGRKGFGFKKRRK